MKQFCLQRQKCTYSIYADVFRGEWQNGLRMMFRDRYLYDLEKFDNSLFEREDLAWIKESYLIILQMAWDREFYDRAQVNIPMPMYLKNGMSFLAILMFLEYGQHGHDLDLISEINGICTGIFREEPDS